MKSIFHSATVIVGALGASFLPAMPLWAHPGPAHVHVGSASTAIPLLGLFASALAVGILVTLLWRRARSVRKNA